MRGWSFHRHLVSLLRWFLLRCFLPISSRGQRRFAFWVGRPILKYNSHVSIIINDSKNDSTLFLALTAQRRGQHQRVLYTNFHQVKIRRNDAIFDAWLERQPSRHHSSSIRSIDFWRANVSTKKASVRLRHDIVRQPLSSAHRNINLKQLASHFVSFVDSEKIFFCFVTIHL